MLILNASKSQLMYHPHNITRGEGYESVNKRRRGEHKSSPLRMGEAVTVNRAMDVMVRLTASSCIFFHIIIVCSFLLLYDF